jgi:Fe/S biogenesis protein NfuA
MQGDGWPLRLPTGEQEVLMLTFTEKAREMVLSFMAQGYVDNPALRIGVVPGTSPFAPEYEFALVEEWEKEDDDVVVDAGGFHAYIDPRSAALLDGSTIDYVERAGESGFEVRNPNVRPLGTEPPTGELADRVRRVLEERINPAVAAHGGHITLVDVRQNVVYVRMSGGCQGCGLARVTLRQGVERMIREAVPEVVAVEDVTDHASGTDPYYRAAP